MTGADYDDYGDYSHYEDGSHTAADNSTDATPHMNVTDYYDYYESHEVSYFSPSSYYIDRVGCIPVSVLGIVGNVLAFIVWNTQKKYNATIFLFKLLAVWDTLFLVAVVPLIFLYEKDPYSPLTTAVNFVALVAKLESVHTTLVIALSRWLAVYRAIQVHSGSLLARRHVIVACVIVFVWCVLIASVFLIFTVLTEGHSTTRTLVIVVTVAHIVGLAIPVVPLVVFNVLLLVKLRSPSVPTSSATEKQQSSSWGNTRRLTVAVMLMSLFSVLAYTVGETLNVVEWFQMWVVDDPAGGDGSVFFTLSATFQLLQQVNNSINIIFYLAFSRNFRKAFSKCFHRCVCGSLKARARQGVPPGEVRGESSSSRTGTESVSL